MSYYNSYNDGPSIWFYIIGIPLAIIFCIAVMTCNNSVADNSLNKLGSNTKSNYQEYNSESWGDGIVGGNAAQKAAYSAVVETARQHHISIYEAARMLRSDMNQRIKTRFGSFNNMINKPHIRSVSRTQWEGNVVVVVNCFTESCDSDGNCRKEYFEVNIPEYESGLVKKVKYEDTDEYDTAEEEYDEENYESGVNIDWEGVDVSSN